MERSLPSSMPVLDKPGLSMSDLGKTPLFAIYIKGNTLIVWPGMIMTATG